MTIAAGTLSLITTTSTTASLSSTAPTGGTGPYTQQWYRSTTTGFSPGAGNLIAGATALTLSDSGLTPGTTYYWKVIYTDTGHSNDTATATQVSGLTLSPVLSQNQFLQSPYLGQLDQAFNTNTMSVQVDVSQVGSLSCGQAVKAVDSAGGVIKVVGCAADSDNVLGFINYNIKSRLFLAGDPCEISIRNNVMYLYATGPISRLTKVSLDLTTVGGVAAITTGSNVVGWAYDKTTAAGQLFRVYLDSPSFLTAP